MLSVSDRLSLKRIVTKKKKAEKIIAKITIDILSSILMILSTKIIRLELYKQRISGRADVIKPIITPVNFRIKKK